MISSLVNPTVTSQHEKKNTFIIIILYKNMKNYIIYYHSYIYIYILNNEVRCWWGCAKETFGFHNVYWGEFTKHFCALFSANPCKLHSAQFLGACLFHYLICIITLVNRLLKLCRQHVQINNAISGAQFILNSSLQELLFQIFTPVLTITEQFWILILGI